MNKTGMERKSRRPWAAAVLAAAIAAPAGGHAAACGSVGDLMNELPRIHAAHGILDRAARRGAAGEVASAHRTIAELDRLIESRDCYFDRIDEGRRMAAQGGSGPGLLPTLREQRDALRAYMDGLPEGFSAGRNSLRAAVQSMNLGIDAATRGGDAPGHGEDAAAELFLHAAVSARLVFAHAEIARARLETEVLGRAAAGETARRIGDLDLFVRSALDFNAAIASEPRLALRSLLIDGRLAGRVTARGDHALDGDRFDRDRHCALAAFKARESLDALARRLGVVVLDATLDGCEPVGGAAVARLSVPEENLIRWREGG